MATSDFETISHDLITPDLPSVAAREILVGLRRRYEEPWRHYHTFEHPREQFDILHAHGSEVKDPLTVGWAFMYHDAIYDPTAIHGRNEELCAQLSEHDFEFLGSRALGSRVARFTRKTAGHEAGETDYDLNFFLDADLAILGASPERYDRYAYDIQKEYAHVPAEQYRLGRVAVLQGLATRVEAAGLYRTELFKAYYEAQAQENIAREIDQLRGVSGE